MKRPRCRWFRTTVGEAFSVECVASGGHGYPPPIVFVGEYALDKRSLARLIAAATDAAKWLERQK